MSAVNSELRTSLRDILYVVFRHKRKILLFLFVTVVLVTAYTYWLPDIYQSQAKLLLRFGRENVSVDPSIEGATVHVAQNRENEVTSELAVLESLYLAESVVDSLGAEALLPSGGAADSSPGILSRLGLTSSLDLRGRAIQKVVRGLSADVTAKSNIITVSYEDVDPQLAQNVLQVLVDNYLERHIEIHAAAASPRFFEEQVDDLREALGEQESRLLRFQQQNNIVSLDLQKETSIKRISDLEVRVDEASASITASEARIGLLDELLGEGTETRVLSRTTGRTNFAADKLKEQITELRLSESKLASGYSPQHRGLIEVRRQIAQLVDTLANEEDTHTEVTTGVDRNYEALQLELQNERSQLQANLASRELLSARLEEYQLQLANLASSQTEYFRLLRESEMAEQEYRVFRENLQRARISEALDSDKVSNVRIVQPVTTPLSPIRPKKLLNITLGIFFGILGGIGLAFLLDYVDDSLNTDSDVVRRINVPVLTSISDVEFDSCVGDPATTRAPKSVVLSLHSKLASVLQSIESELPDVAPRVVAFVGSHSGEGTSTVVRTIAALAAFPLNKRVLLVDASEDSGKHHHHFGVPCNFALDSVLFDGCSIKDLIAPVDDPKISLACLTTEDTPVSSVITHPDFSGTISAMKQDFDIVFFDIPSAGDSSEVLGLIREADGVILVIEAEKTRWQVAAHLCRRIKMQGGNVLGALLNKRRFHIPSRIYDRL